MASIAPETPLGESLSNSVHAKIVEQGWTQEDDTSLAEYIVLMLANGKTKDQIASELEGELLQDASGTSEFTQWLFEQVESLTGGDAGGPQSDAPQSSTDADQTAAEGENASIPAAYDMDMGDTAPDNAPRGPKGLHGGRAGGRGGRGANANSKSGDSVLHRTRGNDRINSHVRGAPKGPRHNQSRDVRPGMQKALNGLVGQPGPGQMMQNAQQGMMPMSPQQQMEFMAMFEHQARMFAQLAQGMNGAGGGNGNGNNGNFPNGQPGQQGNNGRSLFDRVDGGRGRGGARGRGRGGIAQNGNIRKQPDEQAGDGSQAGDAASQMDVESTASGQKQPTDPATTVCYFNLRCTNQSCPYVHQSPNAPEGVTIDMSNTCSFGSACKNVKCVGKHPSPATKRAHQAEQLCKFFPNCANPQCSFKHPDMPLCQFGASCKNQDCQWTHLPTKCKYNPCMNPRCPYQHDDGQNKTLDDYRWSADGVSAGGDPTGKEHVSNRKFIADEGAEEELIKPEPEAGQEDQATSEMIT